MSLPNLPTTVLTISGLVITVNRDTNQVVTSITYVNPYPVNFVLQVKASGGQMYNFTLFGNTSSGTVPHVPYLHASEVFARILVQGT